jgi:hypothetical protein
MYMCVKYIYLNAVLYVEAVATLLKIFFEFHASSSTVNCKVGFDMIQGLESFHFTTLLLFAN